MVLQSPACVGRGLAALERSLVHLLGMEQEFLIQLSVDGSPPQESTERHDDAMESTRYHGNLYGVQQGRHC